MAIAENVKFRSTDNLVPRRLLNTHVQPAYVEGPTTCRATCRYGSANCRATVSRWHLLYVCSRMRYVGGSPCQQATRLFQPHILACPGMAWGRRSLQVRWDAADANDAGGTYAMNMWRYLRVSSVCRATVGREQPPVHSHVSDKA